MKITKLYFVFAKFFWDCWVCGYFNVIQLDDRQGIENKNLQLQCERCKSKRKALLTFDLKYPDGPVRRKKLKRKEKLWTKKQFDDYIDSLSKKKSKKRRKKK